MIFPESATLRPLYPYRSFFTENVDRTSAAAGASVTRDNWGGRKRFYANMQYAATDTNSDILFAFWDINRLTSFTFYDFKKRTYTKEVIATTAGVAVDYTIPAKEIAVVAAYLRSAGVDVLMTVGVEYTISVGTGPLGEDVFHFLFVPGAGQDLKLTYRGRHRYACEWVDTPEFVTDNWNRETIAINIREAW